MQRKLEIKSCLHAIHVCPNFLRSIRDYLLIITIPDDMSSLIHQIIVIINECNSSANRKNLVNKLAHNLSEAGYGSFRTCKRNKHCSKQFDIQKLSNHCYKKRIDVVRIRENFNLYRKITELPFATKSEPQYFPQKNQIISSLLLSFIAILTLKA